MTIEKTVVQMRELPPERQREVLDFVEFLEGNALSEVQGLSDPQLSIV